MRRGPQAPAPALWGVARGGVAGLAAWRLGHGGEVAGGDRGPGAVGAGALGGAVHDRVPAVAQHDEQDARAVGLGAPQRLDLVEAGAVADDREDRSLRLRE